MAVNPFFRNDLAQKKFLIVDDFGDMRSMMRGMLQLFGCKDIQTAASGIEAVSRLEEGRFDIVLCDYNLGDGKSGQQVLEEARFRGLVGYATIFIMVTAENTRDMVMGAVEYEPDGYLSKPFTKDLLKMRLDRLVLKKADLGEVEKAAQSGDYDIAISRLNALISSRPKQLGELLKLKADLCLKAGQIDQAAEIFQAAMVERELDWAKFGLARVRFNKGQYAEARELLQGLIESNPNFMGAYDWLAKTYGMLGNTRQAQDLLQRAVNLSPRAILRQQALGGLALKNKAHDVAEKAFRQAVILGRHSVYRNVTSYTGLAESKSLLNKNREALEVISQIDTVFDRKEDAALFARVGESKVRQRMGDTDGAQVQLNAALELYQRLGYRSPKQATLDLLRACLAVGDIEQAMHIAKSLIRNNHDDDHLLEEIKTAFREANLDIDTQTFVHDIRHEIVQLNNRGVELARNGQIPEAIKLFEETANSNPGNKTINLNAARVLILQMQRAGKKNDQLQRAREYLDRVRAIDPKNQTLIKLLVTFKQLITAD